MKLPIRNYLQQKEEAPSKLGLGLLSAESSLKEKCERYYSNVRQGVKIVKAQMLNLRFGIENDS